MNEDVNIELRKSRPEDIPTLDEMCRKIYGFPLDAGTWRWKFEKNVLGKNCSYVAVVDGRVIAHSGGFGAVLQHKGEKFLGNQLGDLMADPDRRTKGAFSLTVIASLDYNDEDGPHLAFGFANPNSTKVITDRKETIWGDLMVPRLDRVVRTAPFIRRKIKNGTLSALLGFPADLVLGMYRSATGALETNMDGIEEVEKFDSRFDELWERIGAEFARTNVRSSKYLNWRYREHPHHSYDVFAYSDTVGLKGFIVVRVLAEKGLTRGLIVDLISGLEEPVVWNTLLVKGIKHLAGGGADLISCWMFDHMPYYETLKKLHFVNRPSDLTVLVYDQTNSQDLEFLHDAKSWYVSMGDGDVF